MRFHLSGFFFFFGLIAFSQKQQRQITLYFDSSLWEIKVSEAQKLQGFFSNPDHEILSVSIDGYCDDNGNAEANFILSLERARATAGYLNDHYAVKTGALSGKGEIALSGEGIKNPEPARKHNRKVIVTIDYEDPKKAATAAPKDTIDRYEGYKTIKDSLFAGDKIILRHIIFVGGRTVFEDEAEAAAELETLVDYFARNPEIQFAINGHVCCITNSFWDARDLDSGKNNLSENRAKKIFDYFVEKGINPARMRHQGYGRKYPRENVAEQLNKRVEIVILKT